MQSQPQKLHSAQNKVPALGNPDCLIQRLPTGLSSWEIMLYQHHLFDCYHLAARLLVNSIWGFPFLHRVGLNGSALLCGPQGHSPKPTSPFSASFTNSITLTSVDLFSTHQFSRKQAHRKLPLRLVVKLPEQADNHALRTETGYLMFILVHNC